MTIYISTQLAVGVVGGVFFAVCLYVATSWLLNGDKVGGASIGQKKYTVYGEYVITRSIATVFADSEDAAIEQARIEADNVGHDIGTDHPEILWAEEQTQ